MIIGRQQRTRFATGPVHVGPESRIRDSQRRPINIFDMIAAAKEVPLKPTDLIDLTPSEYEVGETVEEE